MSAPRPTWPNGIGQGTLKQSGMTGGCGTRLAEPYTGLATVQRPWPCPNSVLI